jgi:hypothetical protein
MGKKINYQLSTSINEGIFELVITGEVTKDTLDQLHAEVITILKGKK